MTTDLVCTRSNPTTTVGLLQTSGGINELLDFRFKPEVDLTVGPDLFAYDRVFGGAATQLIQTQSYEPRAAVPACGLETVHVGAKCGKPRGFPHQEGLK